MSESRFTIIDGVQVSRARAERLGLIKKADRHVDGPPKSRARTAGSARLSGQNNLKPDDDAAAEAEAEEAKAKAAAAAEVADDAAGVAETDGTEASAAEADAAAAEADEDADAADSAAAVVAKTEAAKPAPKKK